MKRRMLGQTPRLWLDRCLLCLVVALVFGQSLQFDLVYDDTIQIAQNPLVLDVDLPGIFLTSVWGFRSTASREYLSNYYRPLFVSVFAICVHFVGMSAAAFHAVAVLLHLLCCLLVYQLALHLFARRLAPAALPIALAFAVHPVHIESVVWVSGLTDTLCGAFVFACLYLLVTAPETASRRSQLVRSLLVSMFFLCGLLSKEIAIVFPFFWLFYTLYSPQHRRVLLPACLGMAVGAAGYLSLRYLALGVMIPVQTHQTLSFFQLFLNLPVLLAQYLAKAFWPVPLQGFYPFSPILSWSDSRFLLGMGVFLGGCIAFWTTRRHPVLPILWAWFVAFLGPTLMVSTADDAVFADRYLYIPSFSVCLFFGWLWLRLREKRWGRLLAIGILMAASSWSFVSSRVWRTERTLYEDILSKAPEAHKIRTNLAVLELGEGQVRKALSHLHRVQAARPAFPKLQTLLATARLVENQPVRALLHLERALEQNAGDPIALDLAVSAFLQAGQPGRARKVLDDLERLEPGTEGLLEKRGRVLLALHEPEAAIECFLGALQQAEAGQAQLYLELAKAYREAGQEEKALEMFAQSREALRKD